MEERRMLPLAWRLCCLPGQRCGLINTPELCASKIHKRFVVAYLQVLGRWLCDQQCSGASLEHGQSQHPPDYSCQQGGQEQRLRNMQPRGAPCRTATSFWAFQCNSRFSPPAEKVGAAHVLLNSAATCCHRWARSSGVSDQR
jgi:hypothetical protein